VTDRQTDRQTELPWHIRAIAYMLSRVKTEWWRAGIVICLAQGANMNGSVNATVTHCLLLQ